MREHEEGGKLVERAKWHKISSLSAIEIVQPSSSTAASRSPCLPPSHLHPIKPCPSPSLSTDGSSLVDRLTHLRLQESDVRHYPQAILEGLVHIHWKGFVYCDIKPHNLLIMSSNEMKIADFKLIGKVGEAAMPSACGGMPLYIMPDDVNALLYRIEFCGELPKIPLELSKVGKDFLEKCFVGDPEKRWTMEMLLNYQFIAEEEVAVVLGGDSQRHRMIMIEKMTSLSPRSAFDFNSWVSIHLSLRSTVTLADSCRVLEGPRKFGAVTDRIRQLEIGPLPPSISLWGDDKWITVSEVEAKAKVKASSTFPC
ncbi:hypothetical protein ACLOJK_026662 [Asimina triloba]